MVEGIGGEKNRRGMKSLRILFMGEWSNEVTHRGGEWTAAHPHKKNRPVYHRPNGLTFHFFIAVLRSQLSIIAFIFFPSILFLLGLGPVLQLAVEEGEVLW